MTNFVTVSVNPTQAPTREALAQIKQLPNGKLRIRPSAVLPDQESRCALCGICPLTFAGMALQICSRIETGNNGSGKVEAKVNSTQFAYLMAEAIPENSAVDPFAIPPQNGLAAMALCVRPLAEQKALIAPYRQSVIEERAAAVRAATDI